MIKLSKPFFINSENTFLEKNKKELMNVNKNNEEKALKLAEKEAIIKHNENIKTMEMLFASIIIILCLTAGVISISFMKERNLNPIQAQEQIPSVVFSAIQQHDTNEARKEALPLLSTVVDPKFIQWKNISDGQQISLDNVSKNNCLIVMETFNDNLVDPQKENLSFDINRVVITRHLIENTNTNDVCQINNHITFEKEHD
jgi:hypothetical protein